MSLFRHYVLSVKPVPAARVRVGQDKRVVIIRAGVSVELKPTENEDCYTFLGQRFVRLKHGQQFVERLSEEQIATSFGEFEKLCSGISVVFALYPVSTLELRTVRRRQGLYLEVAEMRTQVSADTAENQHVPFWDDGGFCVNAWSHCPALRKKFFG